MARGIQGETELAGCRGQEGEEASRDITLPLCPTEQRLRTRSNTPRPQTSRPNTFADLQRQQPGLRAGETVRRTQALGRRVWIRDNLKDPAQHVSTQHVLRASGACPHTAGPPGPPLPRTHLWRGRPDTGPASRRQREGTQGATQPASATGSEKNFSRGLSAFLKVSFLRWFRQ